MSTRVEKRVVWHPRKENKFVVGGGSQIRLFEWAPDVPEFRLVTSLADLQLMKCFAWSPDPALDDLVAVGSSTGKVDLWLLDSNRYAKDNVLLGNPAVSLPIRSSRSCNALAFSPVRPNLLATGFDKVRGEPSLVVWDIGVASASMKTNNKLHSTPHDSTLTIKPDRSNYHGYAAAEIVTSVSFLPSSPDAIVAGVSNLWLRMFDLRKSSVHVAQASAKVYGIVTDPYNPHRFATYGDGTVCIWDSRRFVLPLLTFTLKDAAADGAISYPNDAFTCVEFSTVRPGTLATLTRETNHVRFWDLQNTPSPDSRSVSESSRPRERSKESSRASNKLSRLSWTVPSASAILPSSWTGSTDQPGSASETFSGVGNVVLSDTRRTKAFSKPIASFALVPSAIEHPVSTNILVVNKEGDIEMHAMDEVPKHTVWSPRGDLTIGAGNRYRTYPGFQDSDPILEPWEIDFDNSKENARNEKSVDRHSRGKASRPQSRMDDRPGARRDDGDQRTVHQRRHARESSLTGGRSTPGRNFSPSSARPFLSDSLGLRETVTISHGRSSPLGEGAQTPRREHSIPLPDATLQLESKGRKHDLNRSASRGRKRQPNSDAAPPPVIEGDVSMLMRSRVTQGYGLASAQHNQKIVSANHTEDPIMSEIWGWINHSRQLLSIGTSKVHGIDFSFQGILGIWEGLEPATSREMNSLLDSLDLAAPPEAAVLSSDSTSTVDMNASLRPRLSNHRSRTREDDFHGNYTAALNTLTTRGDLDKSVWKPTVNTGKGPHRRLALALCNWKAGDEEIIRWEKEGKSSQSACWLLFQNHGAKAIEVLMRSKVESHQMMAGTIAALLQSGSSSKESELRTYCERLIVKLQDPHFRIMLSYIVFNDWNEVLEEEALPLRERIAIALRFLDDKQLSSYLRRVSDACRMKGSIEGLALTGLTPRGLDILQSYVANTGDIQTAALLASFVCPGKYQDIRAERWIDAYRDLLNGWKLFHYRCQFDIDRGKILKEGIQNGDFAPKEWVKTQFLVRCNFCNKIVNSPKTQLPQESIAMQRRKAASCPWCGRSLPRCSVCLMSITIIPDSGRPTDMLHSSFRDTIDDAFIFCQTCRHGGHASHIIEWFFDQGDDEGDTRPRRTCPVADCDCYCNEENGARSS